METSESEDDFQLYSGKAEQFIRKRDELQAKRRELENVIDLLSEDEVENVLKNEDFSRQPIDVDLLLEDAQPSKNCKPDVDDLSDSDDNIPLSELIKNLTSRPTKRRNRSLSAPKPKRPRSKRNSRKRRSQQPSMSQVRDRDVIVFDDDAGYSVDSLPPIDFSNRSHVKRKPKISEEALDNISLKSIIDLNESSEEIDLAENDNLVTLTIEWNNGQTTTREQFKLRRYQKFESIFEDLAKMENVSTNRVLLMYDFKSISPLDTPSSLNLKFYGALIGSVSATEINHKGNLDHENVNGDAPKPAGCMQVKLLLQSKQTLVFSISKHQKMDVLYQMCAEEVKCEKSKLKLTFDGEHVEPSDLVSDLEIEDGDVIHVHIKM